MQPVFPLVLLVFCLSLASCVSLPPAPHITPTQRTAWSKVKTGKFAWGLAASSYQYEDPAVVPSQRMYFQTDWDALIQAGKAPFKGNADYSWSHWEKDLEALKIIKPTHYRFSVEWARIEPQPGVYNEAAIRNYVKRVRQLKKIGVEPIICLWHFTFPSWLYNKHRPTESNWLHPLAASHWREFVRKMVTAFGSDVRFYMPQNEPNGQLATAYIVGLWPPGKMLDYNTYHRALAASIRQFRECAAIIRSLRKDAIIIAVEAFPWWKRGFLDPGNLFYNTMQRLNLEHPDGIYDVCDVMGINYYYSQRASLLSLLSLQNQQGPRFSSMGWLIDPKGLYKNIQVISQRYGKPLMITENGVAVDWDEKRLRYISDHVAVVEFAKKAGYDVRGYFVWSLADNYEWHYGYKAQFGLCAVDPATLDRVLRPSAFYFRSLAAGGKHPHPEERMSSIYLYWLQKKHYWLKRGHIKVPPRESNIR